MSYTLIDVLSKVNPSDGVRMMTVKKTIETSSMLNMFQMETRPNLTSTFFVEGALPVTDYRAYNTVADDSTGINDETVKTELRALAGRISIDPILAEVATREGRNFVAGEVERHSRSMALNWKRFVIGRNNLATAPKGLYGWVDEYNSATNPVLVDFAAAGSTIAAAGASALITKMNELRDVTLGTPDFYLTNRNIINQMQALSVTTAANNVLAQYFSIEKVELAPGRSFTMGMWLGTPLIPVDFDATRTAIMAFDETSPDGSSTTTNSSIVSVRVGDDDVMLLQRRPDGPDIRDYLDGGRRIIEIDWVNAVESRNPASIGRLQGILAV